MSLILRALYRFGVDRFKYTQVVFQCGQFFRGRVGKVAVFYDEAGEISEKSGVFYKISSAGPSSDPPTGANALKRTSHVFQLTRSVQKILAQSLLWCQFSLHALRISDFFFLVNKHL